MPTKKPRIAVTLPVHAYEVIERLAALQKCSRAAVVADLLVSVIPPLMRTVALLEAAQDAPVEVRTKLRQNLERMEMELAGDLGGALAQMDWLAATSREGAEGAPPAGRRRAGAQGRTNPPSVTRGSGGTRGRAKAGSQGRSGAKKAKSHKGKGVRHG
jgi:hypothetical protein